MSNRRIRAMASILVVLAGFYSQPLPVNDQSNLSVASREPVGNDDENQSVAADDADDVADDFVLLHRPLGCSPLSITSVPAFTIETQSAQHTQSVQPTLESQHSLLRL